MKNLLELVVSAIEAYQGIVGAGNIVNPEELKRANDGIGMVVESVREIAQALPDTAGMEVVAKNVNEYVEFLQDNLNRAASMRSVVEGISGLFKADTGEKSKEQEKSFFQVQDALEKSQKYMSEELRKMVPAKNTLNNFVGALQKSEWVLQK